MDRSSIVVRCIAALLVVALAWPAAALAGPNPQNTPEPQYAESGRLLVGVQQGLSRYEVASQLSAAGLTLGRYWPRLGIAEATSPAPDGGATAVQAAAAHSEYMQQTFRYAAPDGVIFAADDVLALAEPPQREPQPNDALFDAQWALDRIEAVNAWNISHGSPQVVVAVIDSGYDSGHPDLDSANIWKNQAEAAGVPGVDDDGNGFVDDIVGWDWVNSDSIPEDPYGHGTHVMGVVAATTGNGIGVAGLGRRLQVAPLRVLDAFGTGYASNLVDAIDYAIEKDMQVINLSLTIREDNDAIRDAVTAAADAGLLVVAAAGNHRSGWDPSVLWPAAYPQVVAVASTDSLDQRSSFSNYGPAVDIAAPGSDILGTYTGSEYRSLSGTSMATPHVSGLLAMLRSLRPELDNDQRVALMRASAEDVNSATEPGDDVFLGAGRINLYQAFLSASDGLSLRTSPATFDLLPAGDSLALQVTVADSQQTSAVAGAVVYALVHAAADAANLAPVVPVQRAITNLDGVANLTIPLPEQAGDYRLRVQVGASIQDAALHVIQPPATIEIRLDSSELTVGSDSTGYTVNLRDDQDQLLAGELPIQIETSVGTLENGEKELTAVARNGVYTGTLYAGTVAATGNLTVSVANRSESVTVRVRPGAPADLQLTVQSSELSGGYMVFRIEVTVNDACGNPVEENTPVRMTSSSGQLEPATIATQAGRGFFVLRVPRTYEGTVEVVAEVPDCDATATLQVEVHSLWMPLLPTQ